MTIYSEPGSRQRAQELARQLNIEHQGLQQVSTCSFSSPGPRPILLKIVPAQQHARLEAEEKMLAMLAEQGIPVARQTDKGHDNQWRWSVLQLSGPSLANLSQASLFAAAGKLLAALHKLVYPHRGCFNPDLSVNSANVFSSGELKTALEILRERELIDDITTRRWEEIDADNLFPDDAVFCHGSFSPATLWARDDNQVELGCLEWACAGPAVSDLATMDLTCRITDNSRFLDVFYAGYGSADPAWLSRMEFYRFYSLCLILAFDQQPWMPREKLIQRLDWYTKHKALLG